MHLKKANYDFSDKKVDVPFFFSLFASYLYSKFAYIIILLDIKKNLIIQNFVLIAHKKQRNFLDKISEHSVEFEESFYYCNLPSRSVHFVAKNISCLLLKMLIKLD